MFFFQLRYALHCLKKYASLDSVVNLSNIILKGIFTLRDLFSLKKENFERRYGGFLQKKSSKRDIFSINMI